MRRLIPLMVVAAMVATAMPVWAGQADLSDLRQATARYHDLAAAEADGYQAFLDCFDNPGVGGMGQHYVDLSALDGVVEETHPEALVYEVRPNGRLKLVAVEYIVPAPFVDPSNPPELFGHEFHLNAALGVWILHAWVWKPNPSGMFEDWNPRVGACP